MVVKVKHTFCRICDPHCPLLAFVDGSGRIEKLVPDAEHPVSKGYACHKGLSFDQVNTDPDRLNYPLRRTSPKSQIPGAFERMSWEQAIEEIGSRLLAIQNAYGPDAIAVYMGNPIAFNSRAFPLAMTLATALGSKYSFSADTQDLANKFAASQYVFGSHEFLVPDMQHTDFLVSFGCNPKISRGTIISTPHPMNILKGIGHRGGRVLYINPRRIESAGKQTGDVMQIKPDTDVYLMAALLHELDCLGAYDKGALARYGKNIDQLRAFVSGYPAARVADVVGVPAQDILQLARDIASAPSVAFHMGTGPNQGRQGTLVFWLLNMLIFVTGNLGKTGGCYKPNGGSYTAAGAVQPDPPVETPLGSIQPVWGDLPGNLLADLILHQDRPIRALINLSGNPLLSMSGETRLRQAFEALECLVSLDVYPSDTVEISDYALPATDWLEREDITFSCVGTQLDPYVQYADAVVAPAYERRNDWWILSSLLKVMGKPSMLDNPGSQGWDTVEMLFSNTPLAELKKAPHQTIQLPQVMDKRTAYDKVVRHQDKKVNCCPEEFAEALRQCERHFTELSADKSDSLKLISLRTNYMHNSWLSNMPQLRRGRHALNPLHINPADATRLGLGNGQSITVYNGNGELDTAVCFDEDLRPGVVAMTHGYGHQLAPGMSLASSIPGANPNRLLPTGPGSYEPLSGMSWMNGVEVKLRTVSGPGPKLTTQPG
jgi:anaerobic selenocysteine-containing dehydrogenase